MEGLRGSWFPVCWSRELAAGKHHAFEVLATPLVAFRDEAGTPVVLRDLCPHRNVPLSCGRVDAGGIRCAYHGWRFAADGRCVEVPALPQQARLPVVRVDSYPVVE